MDNKLFVVPRGRTLYNGKTFNNIEGFDYEDQETGLTLNVRSESKLGASIRIFGKVVRIAELEKAVNDLPAQ